MGLGESNAYLRPEGNRHAEAPFLAGGAFPEAQRTQRGGIENTASGRLDYVDASGVAGGGEVNAVTARAFYRRIRAPRSHGVSRLGSERDLLHLGLKHRQVERTRDGKEAGDIVDFSVGRLGDGVLAAGDYTCAGDEAPGLRDKKTVAGRDQFSRRIENAYQNHGGASFL